MKRFKKIYIFILIILLTGCSGNYDVNINKDLGVEENLNLSIENNISNYEKTLKIFDENKINKKDYSIKRKSDEIEINYNKKYDSIDEYILNSKIYKQMIDSIDYNKTNKYVDIYIDQYIKNKTENDEFITGNINDIDFLQINIKTPYNVIFTNAETSNENVYSWTIDKNTTRKKILLQFSNKEKGISISQIIILSVLCITILIFLFNIVRKYKNANKI